MGGSLSLPPYQLTERVGFGGMAEVWAGTHAVEGWPVAVKIITLADERAEAAFQREVRAVAGLAHANIVHVFDFGRLPEETAAASRGLMRAGQPYLVMELLSGGTLAGWRPGQWFELRALLETLLLALAHAHGRGVVHRDLKPDNVLLGGSPSRWTISDFGLASVLEDGMDESGVIEGTPAYMAPEQVYGRWRDYGPWTDLYALGCLAFELACGKLPFLGRSPLALLLQKTSTEPLAFEPQLALPTGFAEWLARLLVNEPRGRFQRAADALAALRELAEATPLPIGFQPSPAPAQTRSAAQLRRDASLGGGGHAQRPLYGHSLFGLRRVPFVGRSRAREQLWSTLGQVAEEGRPRAIVLEGAPGLGKARLARWLAEHSHEQGRATTLRATCAELPGPADGLAAMVRRFARCEGLSRARALERLEVLGGSDELARGLADWLCPAPAEPAPGTGQVSALIGALLERVSAERALIVVLEDAHWGPEALALARALLQRAAPILVVMTVAPGALEARPQTRRRLQGLVGAGPVTRLTLGPLEAPAQRALAQAMLTLEPELVDRVVAQTQGNPLFTVQLIGDLVGRGLLSVGPRGVRLREGVEAGELALASDLPSLWRARLARLCALRGEADERALELAAVLGREVDQSEWAAACELAGVQASPELLGVLLDGAFATQRPGAPTRWSFVDAGLRQVVLERAGERLEGHHRICAQVVSGSGRVARHALAAGDFEAALGPLLETIRARFTASDYDACERLLGQHAEALRASGRPASDPSWGQHFVLACRAARYQGDYDRASEQVALAKDGLRRHGWPQVSAEIWLESGDLLKTRGLTKQGLEALERAASTATDPALAALARERRALALVSVSRLEDAEAGFADADARYQALGDLAGVGRCALGRANAAVRQGELDRARELAAEATEAFSAVGALNSLGACANLRGEVARKAGDLETAEAAYAEALRTFAEIGSVNMVVVRGNLGLIRMERGRHAEAKGVLEEVLRTFEARGQWEQAAVAHAYLLACAAALQEGAVFDLHAGALEPLLRKTQIASAEILRVIEGAVPQLEGPRAERAEALAAAQREALKGR